MAKKKRLEEKGWKVGNTSDFLNLSPEEVAYVDLKVAMSKALHDSCNQKRYLSGAGKTD